MHGLTIYMKEGLPFELSLENSEDSFLSMFLTGCTSFGGALLFFPSLSLYTVFDANSSNVDKVLSINPCANVYVFREFDVHHKDWLIFLVELKDLVNSVMIFQSQATLQRCFTFLCGFQSVTHSAVVLNFF